MKHFREDNTEGYSPDELDALNEAFEHAFNAEGFDVDADPDFISDMRQLFGAKVENFWQPDITAAELIAKYDAARKA